MEDKNLEAQLKEEEAEKVNGGMYQRIRQSSVELDKSEENINGAPYGRQVDLESEKDDYVNPWK